MDGGEHEVAIHQKEHSIGSAQGLQDSDAAGHVLVAPNSVV
jgi:hypothetical protein